MIKVREVKTFEEMKEPGTYQWWSKDGKRMGINIVCICGAIVGTNERWTTVSENPLTLRGSIKHLGPDCHFHIRNGEIVMA